MTVAAEASPMISLREILSIGFRDKWKIVVAALLPPVLAVAWAFMQTPIYEASSSLLIKSGREYQARDDSGQATQAAPSSTKLEAINSEIEIMTNRAAVEAVINKVGLDTIYPHRGMGAAMSLDAAVQAFWHALAVVVVKQSDVINVSFDHRSPATATKVVEAVLEVYKAKHADAFAESRSQFFRDQIDRDTQDLQSLEARREKIRIANRIFNVEQQRAALFTQEAQAQRDLQDAQARKDELQKRVAFLTTARAKVPTQDVETETDKNDGIAAIQSQLLDLKRAESQLLTLYQPDHPQVVETRRQVGMVQQRLAQASQPFERRRTAPNALATQIDQELIMDQAELVPLDDKIAGYQKVIAGVAQELKRLESANTQLTSINRRIDALETNLKQERDKFETARVQEDLDREKVVSVSVIQPPVASSLPVKPRKGVYAAGGVVGGLLAAAFTLIVLVVSRNTLISAESVERILVLPVLATVPEVSATVPERKAA